MKIYIAIDDTDDLESRGTGEIAEILAMGIGERGWGRCGLVTRHQLLLHPDIPYTSHNSSMCFPAEIEPDALDRVISYCRERLAAESVPAADPGLCVMVPDRVERIAALVEFGQKAKNTVISKQEAYDTAAAHGVHLSEHGGTGQGVIGALAGAGLRWGGNDGRFKGKLHIPAPGGVARVADIRKYGIESVQTLDRRELPDDSLVNVGEWVKPVLLNSGAVLLVAAEDGFSPAPWKACDRKIFKDF